MKLKIRVKQEGKKFGINEIENEYFVYLRYRQEAYLYKNRIFLFGGGGVSGISFSLEHVSISSIGINLDMRFVAKMNALYSLLLPFRRIICDIIFLVAGI